MKEKTEEKPRKKVVVEEVLESQEKEAPKEEPNKELPKTEESKEPENKKVETQEPIHAAPKFNFLWIIIPGLLILLALVGGVFVYEKGVSNQREKLAEKTPEPTFVSSPTPTPTPSKVDLSKFTIAIQNGSGIPGEAIKVQKILTNAGFKVASTANAKTYDYTKTVIQAKKSVEEAYLSQLRDSLSKTYVLGDSQTLSDKEKADVVIIVGKTKPQ